MFAEVVKLGLSGSFLLCCKLKRLLHLGSFKCVLFQLLGGRLHRRIFSNRLLPLGSWVLNFFIIGSDNRGATLLLVLRQVGVNDLSYSPMAFQNRAQLLRERS
jgi:hypothetical protein